MVKVLAFALSEGRVAIHCHAGLGRTGVLIACYLVFSLRVSANDAIRYVRLKRPGSVQTRGQILCVRHFAQFVLPQTITYYIKDVVSRDKFMNEFTLKRFLKRQRVVLHGYDERNFKFIPKIIHCICERILKMCSCWTDEFPQSNIPFTSGFLTAKLHGNINRNVSSQSISSISSFNSEHVSFESSTEISTPSSPTNLSELGDITDSFSELSTLDGEEMNDLLIENRCFQELETQKSFAQTTVDEEKTVQDIGVAIKALTSDLETLDNETKRKVRQYQHELNSSQLGWAKLAVECDLQVLASLLFEWLEGLKVPILQMNDFENIVIWYKQPETCLQKLQMEECYLIEYLLRFQSKIQPISKTDREDLIGRLIAALSQHSISINDSLIPSGKSFRKIGDGTFACAYHLFQSVLQMIENDSSQKLNSVSSEEKHSDNDSDDVEIGFQ